MFTLKPPTSNVPLKQRVSALPKDVNGIPILPLPYGYQVAYGNMGWTLVNKDTGKHIADLPNFDPIYRSYRDEITPIIFTIRFFEYVEENYYLGTSFSVPLDISDKTIFAIKLWRILNGFIPFLMQSDSNAPAVSRAFFYHLNGIHTRFSQTTTVKSVLEQKLQDYKKEHIKKSKLAYYELTKNGKTEKIYFTEKELEEYFNNKRRMIEKSIAKIFLKVALDPMLLSQPDITNDSYLNGEYVRTYDVDSFNPSYASLTEEGQEARKISKDIRILAFLDMIAAAEGTDEVYADGISQGYNKHGGSKIKPDFKSFADHPGGSAAGRYQAIPSTWKIHKDTLGLTDFTPSAQEIFGVYALMSRNMVVDIRQIDENVTNKRFEEAVEKGSKEWASLPNRQASAEEGKPASYYRYSRGKRKGQRQPAKPLKNLKEWYKTAFDVRKK